MPQTVRKYWGAFQGRVHLNYNWSIINHDSVVLITASEYVSSTPPNDEHRFIGAASVTVENIAPHGPPYDPNHGVTFIVNVDNASPINLVTDITVLDAAPIEYWGAFRGRENLNYNWSAIDHDSVVLITASEYSDQHVRFIGDASITVKNTSPHGPPYDPNGNHGVTFIVNVDWNTPVNVVTDITVLDKPVAIQTYVPPDPNNIGLRMQYQESRQWCWIAVATSINHFYHPESTWTQCAVMTDVGRRLNGFSNDISACPPADVVANNPSLQAALANPYSQAAEYILDNYLVGGNREYLKTGNPRDPLVTTGNFASQTGSDLSLGQIAAEVNAGRPVVAHLEWNSNQLQHFVAIAGVASDILLILDPVYGQSAIRFQDFPSTYHGGAQHLGYTLTKRS